MDVSIRAGGSLQSNRLGQAAARRLAPHLGEPTIPPHRGTAARNVPPATRPE